MLITLAILLLAPRPTFHSTAPAVLPESGPVSVARSLPGLDPQMPHGLTVRVDSHGFVVDVKAWGWCHVATNAMPQTADVDHDGFVTGDDADLFRRRFDAGDITADFDGDQFVTGDDFDAFTRAFETGTNVGAGR